MLHITLHLLIISSILCVCESWLATSNPRFPFPFGSTSATTSSALFATPTESLTHLSDEEVETLEQIYKKVSETQTLRQVLLESLQSLPPSLVMKLRQIQKHESAAVREIAKDFCDLLEYQLVRARETLKSLLEAGEVRKLDSLIGKAAREGLLDPAFFNVITVNLRDAMKEEAKMKEGEASRAQVLQHIYTRCQEEVEKTLDPGIALLNKLLRTQQAVIRSNLYKHYLTPQPKTIETPDGKTIELDNGKGSALVSLKEFIDAIQKAVVQIRTVEKSGGTDQESAAIMVESCRSVAKEARVVIGEFYGVDSDELDELQTGLQPVFRPSSADSIYIQGEQY